MKRSSTQHAVHRKLQEKQYLEIIMPPPPITPPGHRRAQSPGGRSPGSSKPMSPLQKLAAMDDKPLKLTLKQKALEYAPPRKLTIREMRITHKAASTATRASGSPRGSHPPFSWCSPVIITQVITTGWFGSMIPRWVVPAPSAMSSRCRYRTHTPDRRRHGGLIGTARDNHPSAPTTTYAGRHRNYRQP